MSATNLKRYKHIFFGVLIAIIVLISGVVFASSRDGQIATQEISVSQVVADAKEGKIAKIEAAEGSNHITIFYKGMDANGDPIKATSIKEERLSVQSTLKDGGVTNENMPEIKIEAAAAVGNPLSTLTFLLPILLLVGVVVYMSRRPQDRNNPAAAFGKSKARLFQGTHQSVTFAEVAGVEEAKQELTEVVEFLKYPDKFKALGARIPKGVLLIGPPGTGKTMLSKAVAGEAGVPFFSISGSEFVEMFVGVGASRVRDLFAQARKSAPCIIFIDEIDAVGRQRGANPTSAQDERDQTLNQILVEMDGFDSQTNIIIIAATNRHDVLDPALLRPGRFDRQVVLDNPDIHGRLAILGVHSRGKPLDKAVTLETLAKQTPGFSGADLENLVNEGAILAARRNRKTISMLELEEAIDRVIAGPERKSRIISEHEKAITAYHEVGHALVARMLPNVDPVHKISIIARGMMGGYTRILPGEDRYMWSKSQFKDHLAFVLGGRAAEEIIFDEETTGASNDIERVTDLARQMVMRYGMSRRLGLVALGRSGGSPFLNGQAMEQRNYSDEVAHKIDLEVRSLVEEAYDRAKKVLAAHKDKLVQISELLIEQETIEGEAFEAMFEGIPRPERKPLRAAEAAEAEPKLRRTRIRIPKAPQLLPGLASSTRNEPEVGGLPS